MPWMVKHAAYLLNRYAVHADGNTSYYRRWNKERKTPICDLGETVLYMLPTAKQMPKMEARFFPAIWLGKNTSTNENILGITNKVVRSRTIRRQVKPEKYNKQLLDVINNTPMTTPTASNFVMIPTAKMMARPQATTETQTLLQQEQPFPTTAAQSATHTSQPPAITDLPMATAPPTQRARAPLPLPTPKRDVADEVAEGSTSKQRRTATRQTAPTRPETTTEPPATRTRITAVTVKTKKGQEIKALSNEDGQEATTEKILLKPWVKNTEGLNKEQTIEGMKQEIRSMKAQQVYTEVPAGSPPSTTSLMEKMNTWASQFRLWNTPALSAWTT